jgi:hypothetical protein
MRLKRYCHGLRAAGPCPRSNLAEHECVRSMDAIEVTHAYQRRPKLRRNVFEFMKNLHDYAQHLAGEVAKYADKPDEFLPC